MKLFSIIFIFLFGCKQQTVKVDSTNKYHIGDTVYYAIGTSYRMMEDIHTGDAIAHIIKDVERTDKSIYVSFDFNQYTDTMFISKKEV